MTTRIPDVDETPATAPTLEPEAPALEPVEAPATPAPDDDDGEPEGLEE
jgi:hypothetical protein